MAVPYSNPLTMTQIKAEFAPRSDPYWNLGAYFRGGNPMIDGRAPDSEQSHALNSTTGLGDANYYNYRNIYHCWVGLPAQAVVPNVSSNANVHRRDNPPVSFGQLKGASKLLPVGNTVDMSTLHYYNASPTHTWTSPYTNISIPFDTAGYTFQWAKLNGGTGPLEFTNPNDLNTAFRVVNMIHGNESAWVCRMTATKGEFQIIEDVFVNIINYNVPSWNPTPTPQTPYVNAYLLGDRTATVNAGLFTVDNTYVEASGATNAFTANLTAAHSSNLTSHTYWWERISGDSRIAVESASAKTTRLYGYLPNDGQPYSARFRVYINGTGALGTASDWFDVDVSLKLHPTAVNLTLISNLGNQTNGSADGYIESTTAGTKPVTSTNAGVTTSGDASGYSYSWSRVSGSTAIACSNTGILNPYWSGSVGLGQSLTAVWRLTATGPGPTKTLDYSITLINANRSA